MLKREAAGLNLEGLGLKFADEECALIDEQESTTNEETRLSTKRTKRRKEVPVALTCHVRNGYRTVAPFECTRRIGSLSDLCCSYFLSIEKFETTKSQKIHEVVIESVEPCGRIGITLQEQRVFGNALIDYRDSFPPDPKRKYQILLPAKSHEAVP